MDKKFSQKMFRQENIFLTKLIGEGNWSQVYEGFNIAKTQRYAVKVISEEKFKQTPKIKELTNAEISILKQCNNPNVIKMHHNFTREGHVFMVLDFCNQGDLGELLENQGTLTEPIALEYLKQIINGFKGLHEVKAMHRDFKVENVMLHNNICKIGDLGFGKQLYEEGEMTKTKLGSNLTMAPEVMRREPYSFQADIWSIGVVYYQLLEGTYPFKGINIETILKKIEANQIIFNKTQISEESINFIKRCLVVDPKKRISWKEIYEHPLILDQKPAPLMNTSELDISVNARFYAQNEKKKDFVPSAMAEFAHKFEKEEYEKRQNKNEKQADKKQIKESVTIEKQSEQEKKKPTSMNVQKEYYNKKHEAVYKNQLKEKEEYEQKQYQRQKSKEKQESFPQIPQTVSVFEEIPIKYQEEARNREREQAPEEIILYFSELAEVKDAVNYYQQFYLKAFNNLRYVFLILLNRYEIIKTTAKSLPHEFYLLLLIKDSYKKIKELIEALENDKDIYGADDYFIYFNLQCKERLLQIFKKYLQKEIIQTFKMFQLLAKDHITQKSDDLDQIEITRIETDLPNWNTYLSNHIKKYWMDLSRYIDAYLHPHLKRPMLVYIFSLSEFETYNRTGGVSYEKTARAVNKFDYIKAEFNLKKKLSINQSKYKESRNSPRERAYDYYAQNQCMGRIPPMQFKELKNQVYLHSRKFAHFPANHSRPPWFPSWR